MMSSHTVCLAMLSVLGAASAQDFKPAMLKFGTHRIVNGVEAEKGKYPWIVALEAKIQGDDSTYACGGSLIAPGYVLTAAHCYYPARTSDIGSVCLGAHSAWWSSCEGQEVKIASVAIHPDYDEWTTDNDIAILKLATDVTSITPVKLADTPYAANAQFSSADIKAVTLGWGTSDYDDKTSPDTLHVGNVNMVNRNDCGTKFAYDQSQITTGMVCANSPSGTDSCQGDSGGPLYVESRDVQVGVVSWGIGCGFTDYPGVYADVGYYNTWITGILENGTGGGGGDSDACQCLDSWEWESTTYNGCQETPDDPNGPWCYTVDVCSSTGTTWAYCDQNGSNSTDPSATEPTVTPGPQATDGPETPTGDCICKLSWEFDGSTYSGCSNTPDDLNSAWCYTVGACEGSTASESNPGMFWTFCGNNNNNNSSSTDAPPATQPTMTPGPPGTDGPDTEMPPTPDTDACQCLDSWEWESTTYNGCQETPDDPNGPWCYTVDVCSSTGTNWAYCDQNGSNSTDPSATEPTMTPGPPGNTNSSTDAPSVTQPTMTPGPPGTDDPAADADACQCLDSWEWESTTYNGCQETPDDPNGPWCYTVDVCSSTGTNWAYCDQSGSNSTDPSATEPPATEPTMTPGVPGTPLACECQSEWEFGGATYQECASTSVETANVQRVVNGQEAEEGKYPWLVGLEAVTDTGVFSCGGSLIAPGYVLTAAHCYSPKTTGDDFGTVYVGAHGSCFFGECDAQKVKIAAVYNHPNYDAWTTENDIAILKLESDVTWVKPVKLAERGYAANANFGNNDDIKAVTMGWGVDLVGEQGYGLSMPDAMQVGNVNMVNRKDCGTKFEYDESQITKGMVCANSPAGTDSCQGDSGGPLYVESRNEQVGVVSWGIGCGLSTHPGVYADVGYYNKWITGITGDLNGPAPPLSPAPPPPPTPAWCYVVADCDGALISDVKPGTFWTTCNGPEPTGPSPGPASGPAPTPAPTGPEPTNTQPTDSTTGAPTTEASTSTDAVVSACGVGSFPTVMENGICPTESHELVATNVDCEAIAMELGMNDVTAQKQNNKKRPRGCYTFKDKLYFNNQGKINSKNKKRQSICCSVTSSSTSSSTSSTMAPSYDNDYFAGDNYNSNAGSNDGSSCKCKASWMFNGETYEQCAFTPDDPNNAWCYTESDCSGGTSSDTYAGDSWAFCNIRGNKRLAVGGAVKHSAATALGSSTAEATGTELDSGAAGGAATAAAGVVAALLVVGAIVVVTVRRSRSRQADGVAAPTVDTVENGAPAQDETSSAADVLERTNSYYDALTATTTAVLKTSV